MIQQKFVVVDDDKHHQPLLGNTHTSHRLDQVQHQNFIARVQEAKREIPWTMEIILEVYRYVFKGNGCLKGKLQWEIDPTVEPLSLP